MQQIEEYGNPALAIEDSHDFAESDLHEPGQEHDNDQAPQESVYTDDPVRVYLREMGSVRLLNRQGEIDLAQRMERGRLRMRKALSRSPLVWSAVLTTWQESRDGV